MKHKIKILNRKKINASNVYNSGADKPEKNTYVSNEQREFGQDQRTEPGVKML
jgi:hypothetical protein